MYLYFSRRNTQFKLKHYFIIIIVNWNKIKIKSHTVNNISNYYLAFLPVILY